MTIDIRNVQDYGAVGDGSTNDTTAINSALSGMTSGVLLFPQNNGASVYKIDGSVSMSTYPIQLAIHNGILLGGTGNLTLYSPDMITTLKTSQAFATTLAMTFSKFGSLYPEWFGAVGDGMTDDYNAFNAVKSALGAHGGTIVLRDDFHYLIGTNILFGTSIGFRGLGYLTPDSGAYVYIQGRLHERNHNLYDVSAGGLAYNYTSVANTWNASVKNVTVSSSGSLTPNLNNGHYIFHVLTENTTVQNPVNRVPGAILTFQFKQPSGQTYSVGFATSYFKLGAVFTMPPGAGSDVYATISFIYDGTKYYELERKYPIS
jgi:hypothetical protein